MSVLPIQYVRPIAVYVPTQPTAEFPVPWPFDDLEDLQVTVDGVLQTGWSLADTVVEAGFFTIATVRLATLVTGRVVIARFTAPEQEAVFPPGGQFRVDVLNRALGRLWLEAQDLVERSNRALYVPVGEENPGSLPARAARAGRYLAFDANGDPYATLGPDFNFPELPDFNIPLNAATAAAAAAALSAAVAQAARIAVESLAPQTLSAASVAMTAAAPAAALAANFYEVVQPVTTTIEAFMNAGGPYDLGDLLPIGAPFAIERLAGTRIDLSRSGGTTIDLGSVA